jgi:hypothetical protein
MTTMVAVLSAINAAAARTNACVVVTDHEKIFSGIGMLNPTRALA